jgi:hypothetical protein
VEQPNLTPKKGRPFILRRTSAVRPGTHDLAAQDGAPAGELLADGLRQRFEGFERIPIARYQPAGAALDISESPRTIQLRLKNPISGRSKGESSRASGIGVTRGRLT